MADLALKRTTSPGQAGAAIREQLRAMEDGDVVAAFLGGEERAFQELVSRYQTRLLNFIYRTISDREKAEDLVQEVFIRVYRHIGRFDRSKKFSTWIYTIASNLAKNELRNRSRNPLVLFQSIKKTSQEDDRPLQFEDSSSRPTTSTASATCASWSRRAWPSCRRTTARCSCCASSRARATRRSPRSRTPTSARSSRASTARGPASRT
jgi:RNA polymerase sigma factor (sigma-70 family)